MSDVSDRLPCAEDMRTCAEAFASRVTGRRRLPLDYSVVGLRLVDFLVDGLRKDGVEEARVSGALSGIGAYVGEVLVRNCFAAGSSQESLRTFYPTPHGRGRRALA